jgi:hypothetical protein
MSKYIKIRDEYFKKSKILHVELESNEGIFTKNIKLSICYAQPYKYDYFKGTTCLYNFNYTEENSLQQDVLKLKNCNTECTFNKSARQIFNKKIE